MKTIENKKTLDPSGFTVSEVSDTLKSIIDRILSRKILLTRYLTWGDVIQSKFIESILIKMPTPNLYVNGNDPNEWKVIDGVQRYLTIQNFCVTKGLKLKNLDFKKELEGNGYDDLPRHLQRTLTESYISTYVLTGKEHEISVISKRLIQ